MKRRPTNTDDDPTDSSDVDHAKKTAQRLKRLAAAKKKKDAKKKRKESKKERLQSKKYKSLKKLAQKFVAQAAPTLISLNVSLSAMELDEELAREIPEYVFSDTQTAYYKLKRLDEVYKEIVSGVATEIDDAGEAINEKNAPTALREAEGICKSLQFMIDMAKRGTGQNR